jgi:hypothetical protein
LFANLTDTLTSSMRSETRHLAAQMRKEMKELAEEVDTRRKALRHESDLFKSSQKLASSREWIVYSNGKHFCAFCTRHSSHFTLPSQINIVWILGNSGVSHNDRFSDKVCKHEDSQMHDLSTDLEEQRGSEPLQFSLQMKRRNLLRQKLRLGLDVTPKRWRLHC